MSPTYNVVFVLLSVAVAMLASFAALDLAGRVRTQSGSTRLGWLLGGATVMGLSIWSMHFVGMLAFHLPVPIGYDFPLMLLSVVVAIGASLLALTVVNRPELGSGTLIVGGLLMGAAIAGMHYLGMASMRADARISYDAFLVGLSIVVAIVASLAALWLAFRLRLEVTTKGTVLKLMSAGVMGLAISGMHYTGMAAARFSPGPSPSHSVQYVLASDKLGIAIVIGAILIVVLALVGTIIDRSIQASSASAKQLARHAADLGRSEAQYRLLFDENPNPMWVFETDSLTFLAVNEAAVQRYGYSREEFLSMTLNHLRIEADSSSNETKALAAAGKGNFDPSWTGRHRKKDGTLIDVSATARHIVFDGHEACLGLAIDVSDWKRADAAVRENEQRTRLIIDTALDAVITMDSEGLISGWNAQAESMFGYSRAEAMGQVLADTIIPATYRDAHKKGLKHFLETGHGPILNKRIELMALKRDGSAFPVELAISPSKVGSEWTFNAFVRDLTEQKKTAEALRAEEQRYRDLFEDVTVGLYWSTPDGFLIDANPAMVSMLGYADRKSLLAVKANCLYVDPADRVRWKAEMMRDGAVQDFEARLHRADGTIIWTRETTHARREADGTVILYQGVLEDITARVDAEHHLEWSERRVSQILEALPLGIMVSNGEGVPVFANAAAQKLLGSGVVPTQPNSDIAATYNLYLAGTDKHYPSDGRPLMQALSGHTVAVDDMEIRRNGQVVALNVQAAPIRDLEGKTVAAVVAFMDTTDRKALEHQVRHASKMEAVGQLAGGVAHDFNNLLTVIMSYGVMLLDRLAPSDPNRADVQEIASAAERAAGLTRQLLAFSRKQVMQPRVLDINAVIADVENMLRRVIGEDIELHVALDSDVARIHTDPGQLQQVLMNLVVNARDAMPKGGRLSISTSNAMLSRDSKCVLGAAHGHYVALTVSDSGSGMTDEVQQRIFEPFFTTKEPGSGTGLGLATVYGIVKQSEGDLCVTSQLGEGSSFAVYFPRFISKEAQRRNGAPQRGATRGTETILLVEDDASLRTLVVRILKTYGYEVLVASGGIEALALASDPQQVIDAVISDVVMPDMSGRELVEKLLEARPGLSTLLMSGYTDDEVLRRGVLHGETSFLQKPFTPDQLARKVRSVLDRVSQ